MIEIVIKRKRNKRNKRKRRLIIIEVEKILIDIKKYLIPQ
jgi:hypothetical protein